MKYTTDINKSTGICIIHVTGRIKRPYDSLALQQLARGIDEKQGTHKFLFNMMEAQVVGESIDALQVGIMPTDPTLKMRSHRTALVYSQLTAENTLMEDALADRGYNVRVFYSLGEANEWLMEK
jgi:hypothetical protein